MPKRINQKRNTLSRVTHVTNVMNNSGQVIQLSIIIIALFMIGFFMMFGSYIVAQFNTATSADFSTEAKDFITNSEPAWSYADAIYPVVVILLLISVVVTYLYIPTHPVLVIIEFFMLLFVVFVGGILGNVNQNIFNDTVFNSTATNFPMISLVNNNLGFVATIFGLIVLVALFMKRGEQ